MLARNRRAYAIPHINNNNNTALNFGAIVNKRRTRWIPVRPLSPKVFLKSYIGLNAMSNIPGINWSKEMIPVVTGLFGFSRILLMEVKYSYGSPNGA